MNKEMTEEVLARLKEDVEYFGESGFDNTNPINRHTSVLRTDLEILLTEYIKLKKIVDNKE
ncbi:hypothetical protein [Jeotgalibacillus proteolyticus]|uniref:Uncharacterized protein n=1 Tax=Jeotgalibacillus proteolyticus TaxID=2082395 RepID=A0A2S5GB25_9BACL|nr:hypothetical protein [Jeotgalibacillus proteolyticus]PPA70168.1 hypothetical protein C4B60_11310 [Jeotgalibacillus proteolyticus]